MKVTCGLILDNNKILVVQRGTNQHHAGKWEFPGGKVKQNESINSCLKRELLEELNIDVEIYDQLQIVEYIYPEFEIELIPLICQIDNGKILLKEHAAMKWCSFDELLDLDFSEADRVIIQRIKKAGRLPALGNSDKK
ncbi:MAG: hypothetical protein C0599_04595 [Salinivirgaceae bacterium]|nr:MAG: hypothetical protein C0599_04595 [Salinivirgaceae bacterium]